MGEFAAGGGLHAVIDNFFNSMDELSSHTDEIIWQKKAISAAETMAGQFRTLGEYLSGLENQLELETKNAIGEINTLITQIAQMNDHIERSEIAGSQANNLRDQRDQYITKLSQLIDVETNNQKHGVVNVIVSGIPVVVGASSTQLAVGTTENNKLGVAVAGTYNYTIEIKGGKIGGLLSLRNTILSNIQNNLNTLANNIVQQINNYHTHGVGSEGSFTSLSGWALTSNNLDEITPPVSDGSFFIRLTNTATGEITRHEIAVDADTDTLTSVAAAISAITGLTASVQASKFIIKADTNYQFDFIPAVLPEPSASTLTGSPPSISVSGIYKGTENQTFTFTVEGTGSVGNGTLKLNVTDGNGDHVTTLNVGSGYAAGDLFDLGNGIKVSLGTGNLNNTETFEVDAFADTDTTDFLSAVGLNTFFSGTTASDIKVCSGISSTPGRIAASTGQGMDDNNNILRMAGVGTESLSALGAMTPGNYYRNIVTDIAQQLSIKDMQVQNLEVVMRNLVNQRGEVSGININDEAAQLLIYEQMFQAMAKYISTVQTAIQAIMNII
ncbi:MAG: hypothetical protein E4H40_00400 [Candidatus Brocadiia bacterium]|nr:MAG: hypothetical protein E4H40_00400 [Candidatus Brocadiia bacterium]